MSTDELIKALREWAAQMALPGRRELVKQAADRLEELDEAPSVDVVPLDKLCELLAENSIIPCEYCQYFSNKHCTAIGDTNKPCPNSEDSWRNTLTKWMEEQE